MTVKDNTLVYDIETRTFGKPNPNVDRLKIFGCRSYKTKKIYLLTDKEQTQKIVNAHKYLVGFNNVGTKIVPGYDNTILQREGISLKYKNIIDLKNIFKQRASQMKIKEGMLGDLITIYSLDFITRLLGIVKDDEAKLEIDYKKFQKDVWSPEEIKEINEYTKRDIEVTSKLYEWLEDYFDSFKEFIHKEDVDKKVYLKGSLAKFGYKAICKAMNWSETYGEGAFDDEKIGGGYVAYPAGEKFEGNIYCLDFNSLYPHIMIMCNLYGREKEIGEEDRPVWNGNNKWKVDGRYFSDKLHGVGELFIKWYSDRTAYKKVGDRREYTIKILLNLSYGILNSPYYLRVYDRTSGGDCTRIGRQWAKYARKIFRDNGYKIIYTDTDSVYIVDPFNDKEKMLKVKQIIIDDIKVTVPFPQDTFDMGIDDEIKYMYFFKGGNKDKDDEMDEDDFLNKPKGFMKKNYIYVTKDGTVKIKNLGIRKKSNSPLSQKIFWDYLVPKIKEGQIKFSKTYLKNLIKELLEKDFKLASLRRDVGNPEQYKSQTCQAAQIALKYGSGVHFLIPNLRGLGIGKGKKLCTIDEFKEHDLNVEHIDLDNIWKELKYFIKPVVVRDIFSFGK
jgi:hypothetical protein